MWLPSISWGVSLSTVIISVNFPISIAKIAVIIFVKLAGYIFLSAFFCVNMVPVSASINTADSLISDGAAAYAVLKLTKKHWKINK